MNFQNYFYKEIGKRIRTQRKEKRLSQESIDIDTPILSKIENGITHPTKNPYLINGNQLNILCEQLEMDKAEIVWGNREEQKNFVKMILISVLMSCNQQSFINPFCSFEFNSNLQTELISASKINFLNWALKQPIISEEHREKIVHILSFTDFINTCHKEDKKTDMIKSFNEIYDSNFLSELIELFTKEYSFFFSNKNFDMFNKLLVSYDARFQQLSDILFKHLLQNYQFAKGYAQRASNYIFNIHFGQDNTFYEKTESLLVHPSQYMDIALDYKEMHYYDFILAFNQLWNNHSKEYMDYFDKNLFYADSIYKHGLKQLQSEEIIKNIILSDKFYNLCNKFAILDIYKDTNSLLAHNYFTLHIQLLTQKNLMIASEGENKTLLNHLVNTLNETDACAQNILS